MVAAIAVILAGLPYVPPPQHAPAAPARAPHTPAPHAQQQPAPPAPSPDVPLLLSLAQGRDMEEVFRELDEIDLAPLEATVKQEKDDADAKIGPIRFPITTAITQDPRDNGIVTASSFFSIHYYFDNSVDLSSISSVNLEPLMDIRIADDLSLDIGGGIFWRDSRDDGAFGNSTNLVTGADASDDAFLGTELSIVLEWEINRNFSLMTSYSHFFAGSFLEATGAGEDIDFFGVAAAFKF